jgi:hypothetical protein
MPPSSSHPRLRTPNQPCASLLSLLVSSFLLRGLPKETKETPHKSPTLTTFLPLPPLSVNSGGGGGGGGQDYGGGFGGRRDDRGGGGGGGGGGWDRGGGGGDRMGGGGGRRDDRGSGGGGGWGGGGGRRHEEDPFAKQEAEDASAVELMGIAGMGGAQADGEAPVFGESTGIDFDAYEDIPVETSGDNCPEVGLYKATTGQPLNATTCTAPPPPHHQVTPGFNP